MPYRRPYRPRGGRRPKRKGRVTAKRAYKARKTTSKIIAAVAETKKRDYVSSRLPTPVRLSTASAFNLFPCHSYLFQNRGNRVSEMDGKQLFSKYLTMKMLLKFPCGRNAISRPLDIYWYKVWVSPSALAYPQSVTVANPSGQKTIDDATEFDALARLNDQVRHHFDVLEDRMEFLDRRDGVRIIDKGQVRVNRDGSIPIPQSYINSGAAIPNEVTQTGCLGDWYKSFSFNTKQKLTYEFAPALIEGADHLLNRPPKQQGFPAVVLYCPQYETAFNVVDDPDPEKPPIVDQRILVEFSDCHWYQDL